MKVRYFRCPPEKAAQCPYARSGAAMPHTDGGPFQCAASTPALKRRCEHELIECDQPRSGLLRNGLIVAVFAILLGGWWLTRERYRQSAPTPKEEAIVVETPKANPLPEPVKLPKPKPEPPAPIVVTQPVVQPEPLPKIVASLRLVAEAPLGEELLRPVVMAFLQSQEHIDVTSAPGAEPLTSIVSSRVPNAAEKYEVTIVSKSEGVKLTALAEDKADAVISVRRAQKEEVSALRALGDMSSPACEDVIALDALAVIAHKSNTINELTTQQLRRLLREQMTDWNELGGPLGRITLHLPRENSAALEALRSTVTTTIPRLSNDKRYDDPMPLADGLAGDPLGLGLVPMRHVRLTKALAIGDDEVSERRMPSPFTVATETYRLRQRVYLHHAEAPKNPLMTRFLSWLISEPGQVAVSRTGFIDLNLRVESRPLPEPLRAALPPTIARDIQNSEIVDTTIFFAYNRADLDTKALADLNRMANLLAKTEMRQKRLLLFGHADNRGTDEYNLKLSSDRAKTVESLLIIRGIRPAAAVGIGKQMPVMSNDTDEGMARNRRVEVWLVEMNKP